MVTKTIKMKDTPKSAMFKKMKKLVAEIDIRDKNPADTRSDRKILDKFDYSKNTKMCEIRKSKNYLLAHEAYFKNYKSSDVYIQQAGAKARKNVLEGLDSNDEKIKLEYTKTVFSQEERDANKTKLRLEDLNGNILELMGNEAKEHMENTGMIEPRSIITEDLEDEFPTVDPQ